MTLKEIRLHFSNITQGEAAVKLGKAAASLSLVENKELEDIKYGVIKQYAALLNVPVLTIINYK